MAASGTTRQERDRRLVFVTVAAAAVVGGYVLVSPAVALVLGLLVLLIGVSRGRVSTLLIVAIGLVLFLPTGWNFDNLVSTQIGVGDLSTPAQILVPLVVVALVLVSVRRVGEAPRSWPPFIKAVAVFLVASALAVVIGLVRGAPLNLTYRDARSVALYAVAIAVWMVAVREGEAWRKQLLAWSIVALSAFSVLTLVLYLEPAWRHVVYAGQGAWESASRVGFGTTSLLVLFVPVALVVAETGYLGEWWRPLAVAAAGLMTLSVVISQSRSTILGLAAGVVFYVALRLVMRREGGGRVGLLLTVGAVVLGIGMLAISAFDYQNLFVDIAGRGLITLESASTQTRLLTIGAALSGLSLPDWGIGLGFGQMVTIISSRGFYYGTALFVDNSVVTALLKGGMIMVISLLAVAWTFVSQTLRALRDTFDSHEGLIWLAVFCSLPGFLAVTGVSAAHLMNSPAVIVGVGVLGGLAATALRPAGRASEAASEAASDGAGEV
jgi:hypothetical protein